jgi:hypothetical protein
MLIFYYLLENTKIVDMKKLLLFFFLSGCYSSFAQLVIYNGTNQTGTSATCVVSTIYKGTTIPASLNNQVSSIVLQQGFMATLAENEDGTGEAYTFIAATSNITVNLNKFMNDKVSFIRVLPFRNTLKKGAGLQNNAHIDQLDVSWFYDWGPNDVSLSSREYALMSWGRTGANSSTNINNYINKPEVTHLLSFNEPDNTDQSNVPFAEAVTLHENLAQTGLRLGSPAPTESQAFVWLKSFMAGAKEQNVKVDYVAIHWYDWGSYLNTLNTSPNANDVFNRFKNYVNNIYAIYGKPIWITEFNANRNTTSATHQAFIALALPWLEAQPFVERYAYFFPPALPPVDANGNITPIGTAYKNFAASTLAIKENYDNTELLTDSVNTNLQTENATIYGGTIANCTNASGGRITNAVSGGNIITFHNIVAPTTGSYNLEVNYFSTTNRNITVRVNYGTTQTVSITASGSATCAQGGARAIRVIPINLLAGANSIELSDAPILDFINVRTTGTLPVSLLNFTGGLRQSNIQLNWSTATEQNSKYFDILKSTNGENFYSIGTVNAAGNSTEQKNYFHADHQPAKGLNYYKLKLVDADGSYTYSKVVLIKNEEKANQLTLVAQTNNSIKVSATSSTTEKATIMLLGLDGKTLYKQNVLLNNGANFIDIPASMVKGNIAIIALTTSKGVSTIKVMQ